MRFRECGLPMLLLLSMITASMGQLTLVQAGQPVLDTNKEVDNHIYMFGYGYSWSIYEYLNDDGELMGLGYDITRTICKVMNKKCEHVVFYDYGDAYSNQGVSKALNDGWYDALVNWPPTPRRLSSYAFSAPIAMDPSSYMYVRSSSPINNTDDIKSDANFFGFRKGFYTSPDCLSKYLRVSLDMLEGKAKRYADAGEQEDALRNNEVDVIFADEIDLMDKNAVKRIGGEPIQCTFGGHIGMAVMYRKDKSSMFSWYDEGLKKIKENGDYAWLCNMNRGVDYDCIEDLILYS